MIVKILSSSASFHGVSYNTDKIDKNTGQLMAVNNFGALQGLANLRPEDYKNYLKMVSATNKAVKKPQFHAAISAEGRSYDKNQLTEIAIQWLEKMGYGDQPYLVVFHKDTANNHVHIVTTRINRQGKKIDSGFENSRALRNLNEVVGIDEKQKAKSDIEKALAYSFSTKAQFMMILESQGYKLAEKEGKLNVIKFGRVQGEVNLAAITEKLQKTPGSDDRKKQVAALLYKYAPQHDSRSLAAYLKKQHGIDLLFHAKDGKTPYGYSVIDHAGKAVYKGGEVMPLQKLLAIATGKPAQKQGADRYREPLNENDNREYCRALLYAAMKNYPDIRQGLRANNLNIFLKDDRYMFADFGNSIFFPLDQLLDTEEYGLVLQTFAASGEINAETVRQHVYVPAPVIASSVDDEAVHGRKRRKITGATRKRSR